jgi:peptidoglycan/xylan/chitin deacetylase (PgdA/CDA1 family)
MRFVRTCALYVLRATGMFAVARHMTRKQLRILCYHGFSIGDEYEVAPMMFMRAETFTRRMQILTKHKIPVVPLDEAVKRFQQQEIQNAETVITLDDGWASNLLIGLPILERFGYPACIYMTTEHLAASAEVFNVALSYMISRSGRDNLTLKGLHPLIDGVYDIKGNPDAANRALIAAAERALPLAARQQLLHPIADALGLDLADVLRDNRFRLLTREEIQELFRRGVDIQLHSHTHRLPDSNFEAMAEEIRLNRETLREMLGSTPCHFCYPSGQYSGQHPEWLKRLGIVSGTTCDPGLNAEGTSPLLLKRFLDSDHFSDIEFEAEICGTREIARRIRGGAIRLLNLAKNASTPQA